MKNFIILCMSIVILALSAKIHQFTFDEAIRPIKQIEQSLLDKALKTYGKKKLCN